MVAVVLNPFSKAKAGRWQKRRHSECREWNRSAHYVSAESHRGAGWRDGLGREVKGFTKVQ